MVGESRFTGRYCVDGAAQDLAFVERLLSTRASNELQLERLTRRMLDKTEHSLSESCHAEAIRLIASELVSKITISGRAVRHFFEQATRESK